MEQEKPKAKRGRPALPAEEVKRTNLTFRTRGGLRDQLEEAAKESGRSISEEAEQRIIASFDRVDEIFGSRALYGIMQTVAAAMKATGETAMARNFKMDATNWLDDPYSYDQAVKAAHKILEAFRPEGEIKPPARMRFIDADGKDDTAMGERLNANIGEGFAAGVLDEISSSEPRSTVAVERAPRLKRELSSSLLNRLTKKEGMA